MSTYRACGIVRDFYLIARAEGFRAINAIAWARRQAERCAELEA